MIYLFANNSIAWLSKIYFGVPQRFGKSVGGLQPGSKILVFGAIGLPLLTVMSIAGYADIYHSILPVQMLIAGAVQFAIETDPSCSSSVPPRLVEAIHRLTPEQLDMSDIVFRCALLVATIYAALLVWSLFKAIRLAMSRVQPNHD